MPTIEENIIRFEQLLGSVQRTGIPNLINYIRNNTDFYHAPASTRFHLSCDGGLLQHSLNVYDALMAKKADTLWANVLNGIPNETLIITALLHDLCKINYYVAGTKNQKTYDPDKVAAAEAWQVKHDAGGNYIWETVPTYNVDDQIPLGHGEKSVILIQQFMYLTLHEVMGIRWHMGFSLEKESYSFVGNAMEKFPLVLALYEADLEASKIMETVQAQ